MNPAGVAFGPERVAAFYAQAPAASRVNLALGVIAVGVMWGRTPMIPLLLWAVFVLASNAVRIALWARHRRDPERDARWPIWARRCVLAMAGSGAVWGLGASALISPESPLLMAFWLILVTGIAAGVVAANAFLLPATWAYLLPLLLPPILRIAALDGFEHLAIATGLSLYLVFCLQQGIHQSRLIRDSFSMRAENAALIQQLQAETREAQAARQSAEDSARAKSRFFAAASHDLRQPLQAVSLYAAALHHAPLPERDRQCVDGIGEGVRTLNDLFDELLEFARLDARSLVVHAKPVELATVFARLATLFGAAADAAATPLVFRPRGLGVVTDELLLTRLLGNLIGNALKYAPGHRVAVLARRRPAGIRIEVRDAGPGIPDAQVAMIFEEFYQVDNPGRDHRRGFGLGLPSAARLADLLGGQVRVRTQPGCGSTFRVDLPMSPQAQLTPATGTV